MAKKIQKRNLPVQNSGAQAPAAGAFSKSGLIVRHPHPVAAVIIFLFSFLIYSNTLQNKYALDDSVVLTENQYTKKGVAGIKDLFTHDIFEGIFGATGAQVITGGRYRPLSAVSLAMEYELMRKIKDDKRHEINAGNIIIGENDPYLVPAFSHGINILLFALTGIILYYFLLQILPVPKGFPFHLSLPFLVAMLFATLPIHTEAVANIKGRDEILCMLFSILSLMAAIKYSKTGNIVHLAWGGAVYFLALLSKENAITIFAVVPLVYFFFTKAKPKNYVIVLCAYLIPVAAYLIIRGRFTQASLGSESQDMLNNPFLLATTAERYATSILTFLLYIKLLVFPYPLTHDYYYNKIPYVNFDNGMFILSLLINGMLNNLVFCSFLPLSLYYNK